MKHRILNLGAGTQSSVLLIMADRGEIEPVEVAIFADTKDEPREVYEHFEWLKRQVKNTRIECVESGDLAADAIEYQRSHSGVNARYASIPLWTANGAQRRQCTKYYKVIPIRRWIRANILGLPPRGGVPKGTTVTQVFGISFDERDRMRIPRTRFERFEYPLVEKKLRRHNVISIAGRWFPGHTFPRSACKRCPYRLDDEWTALTPEEFAEALRFRRRDARIGYRWWR